MQGSNEVEGFGLAGQAERLLALPGPFHIIRAAYDSENTVLRVSNNRRPSKIIGQN